MRKLVLLLPVLIVLVSGCATISPEDLARASPVVKNFLAEYPNAKITATHFTESQAESMLEVIKQDCDNPYIEAKEYYRFTVDDNETGFKAVVWIDWENQIIECAYKEGYLGKREYGDRDVDPNRCVSRHIRKCHDNNAYWYDSCGNKQEKAEACNYGCAEGRCVQSECRSHAQTNCYGRHVYWFDSCGNVQEKKEYCEYGCEKGFCKRPSEKSCTEAGGYCTYPTYGCPEDARVCPDGTVVTRVGPNCEFTSCPITANCAMVCQDGTAVECKTVNNYCVCDSCPTASTDSVTGNIYDTDVMPVSGGGGGGGSSTAVPTATSSTMCDEYYVCPNGEKVRHCELVKTETPGTCVIDESGVEVCSASGASVGCVCRENPEEACPSIPTHLSCKDGYKLTDDYWCPERGVCCMPETDQNCAVYVVNGVEKKVCATCGNGVCEDFETCTSSHCSGDVCTDDCGGLYCPQDCETTPECTDSDGGVNYNIKGSIEWVEDGEVKDATDYCSEAGLLGEWYCNPDQSYVGEIPSSVEYNCAEEGKVCEEGACVEETIECAGEGELTSGAVAPEYYYGCCEGLASFDPYPTDFVGGGMLCYDPEKGYPICWGKGTDDEGWIYTNWVLIRHMDCIGQTDCEAQDGFWVTQNNTMVVLDEPYCQLPFPDHGEECTDSSQCYGNCAPPEELLERGDVNGTHTWITPYSENVVGTCNNARGCFSYQVLNGVVDLPSQGLCMV
jgi:hypothetical protein